MYGLLKHYKPLKRIRLTEHIYAFIVPKDPSASNFPSALSVTAHPADIWVTSSYAKLLMSQPQIPQFLLIFTSINNSNLIYWYKRHYKSNWIWRI
jgi:hypothetical protein